MPNRSVLAAPLDYARRKKKETRIEGYRSEFDRDRDRILYSTSFRRLAGKTQIFLPLAHDHVRTRLSHTLEVAQIARTLARQMDLDEVLAEAIALGHDLGHTPFGHVGERTLSLIMNGCFQPTVADLLHPKDRGFKHNLQSIRAVADLNESYPKLPGLNVTNYTAWGIRGHSRLAWTRRRGNAEEPFCPSRDTGERGVLKCRLTVERQKCKSATGPEVGFYSRYDSHVRRRDSKDAWSFEAFVVRMADEIAQRHHDLEDGILAGLLSEDEVVDKLEGCFQQWLDQQDKRLLQEMKSTRGSTFFVSYTSKFIVNFLDKNLANHAVPLLQALCKDKSIKTADDFAACYSELDQKHMEEIIAFEPGLRDAHTELKDFLRNRILNSYAVQRMDGTGSYVIRKLFNSYLANPQQMSNRTLYFLRRAIDSDCPSPAEALSPTSAGHWRDFINNRHNADNRDFQVALIRTICDHIAAMTDGYALRQYQQLYGQVALSSLHA